MKKRTIIAMAIAATTLGFATVHAHPRFGMGPGPMMMGPGGEGGLIRRAPTAGPGAPRARG